MAHYTTRTGEPAQEALVQHIKTGTSGTMSSPVPTTPDGASLYSQYCASCHGNSPRLGGESASGLTDAITRGEGDMPPFGRTLSSTQIEAIVQHIRTSAGGAGLEYPDDDWSPSRRPS
jgi:mono/diheme cytochrome c family protein